VRTFSKFKYFVQVFPANRNVSDKEVENEALRLAVEEPNCRVRYGPRIPDQCSCIQDYANMVALQPRPPKQRTPPTGIKEIYLIACGLQLKPDKFGSMVWTKVDQSRSQITMTLRQMQHQFEKTLPRDLKPTLDQQEYLNQLRATIEWVNS
jgi:hypothetical protein